MATASVNDILRPVIYELGVALYLSQLFETNVLFLVALLSGQDGKVSAATFRSAFDDNAGKTLGALAKKFKEQLKPPARFDSFIREGVALRNRVVHGFTLTNRDRLLTVAGRAELIDELRDAQHAINDRLTTTSQMLDRALQIFGGSLDQLRKDAEFRLERGDQESDVKH